MADLPSSFSKVTTIEMRQDSLNSELQYLKLGSNDNYLKDNLDAEIANRVASRAVITPAFSDIKTEVNLKLVNYLRAVHEFTVHVSASVTPGRNVFSYFAYKDMVANITVIKYAVFHDTTDSIVAFDSRNVTGLLPSAWNAHSWNVVNSEEVRSVFYVLDTIAIP